MKRSDEVDLLKRLENLGPMQDVRADFATTKPVVSARGSGLDPGILRSDVFEGHSTVIPVVPAASGMDHAALSRAAQLSVDAKAVRDFLHRTTKKRSTN